MDEIRDYRFYKSYIIQPTEEAENYIWKKWQDSHFTSETKSKVDELTFKNIHEEFSGDSEEERFEKIDDNIHYHDYTNMELAQLRKEMYEVFFSDCEFKIMERNLDKIMDNMLY